MSNTIDLAAIKENTYLKRKRYLHKNISFLLDHLSLDITSLASETNIPITTLFRMKKEGNNPTLASLEPLVHFFGIELDHLLYEDISSEEYQDKHKAGNIHYLPTINLEEINVWPSKMSSKVYIGTIGNFGNKTFGINIGTNSMAPIFYKNTIAIVDPNVQPMDNDYIFCSLDNKKTPLFRQLFIDGNNYFFKPLNPDYGDMKLIKNFKIIGVVVKSIENYR